MSLTVKLINNKDDFDQLEHEWNDLYEKSDHCTVFSSWDWMMTWWEVFGVEPVRQLYILCVYDGDQLLGVAPFQIVKKFPLSLVVGRKLLFIGNGEARKDSIVSEYGDLIVSTERRDEVCESLLSYLFNHNDWDFADFDYLLKDSLILRYFQEQAVQSSDTKLSLKRQAFVSGVRYTIPQGETFDDYIQSLGSRWSKMYAKKNRKLERDGEIKYLQSNSERSIEDDLDLLAKMNKSRWSGRSRYLIFDSEKFNQFHKKILERLVPQERAYIKILTLNDEPLAAIYLFSDKSQVHYYQSGFFTKKANAYSPLFLLVCKEIGLMNESNKRFDFMYSSENSYKQTQYAAKSEDIYRLIWTHTSYRLSLFNSLRNLKARYEKMRNFVESLPKKRKPS